MLDFTSDLMDGEVFKGEGLMDMFHMMMVSCWARVWGSWADIPSFAFLRLM